jgi:hypothetical protein
MLCGISVVSNSFDEFGLMRWKRSSENRQVLIGFQSTKAFSRLQYAGVLKNLSHRFLVNRLFSRKKLSKISNRNAARPLVHTSSPRRGHAKSRRGSLSDRRTN